jgi:ribosome maturation protein Sdo1
LGADNFNIGTRDYFNQLATDDIYGDAVKSSLLAGPNNLVLNSAGVNPVGVANIDSVAKTVLAKGGGGLTPQQRENVIAEARARNANIDAALTNAALYGYNNQYYVNLGYPNA